MKLVLAKQNLRLDYLAALTHTRLVCSYVRVLAGLGETNLVEANERVASWSRAIRLYLTCLQWLSSERMSSQDKGTLEGERTGREGERIFCRITQPTGRTWGADQPKRFAKSPPALLWAGPIFSPIRPGTSTWGATNFCWRSSSFDSNFTSESAQCGGQGCNLNLRC